MQPHPGNLNADAVDGGRLVYYDFGMMGTIPSDIREGLLDLFYGVYQKDPDLYVFQHLSQSLPLSRDTCCRFLRLNSPSHICTVQAVGL